MAKVGDWVGDLGHLMLADTALSELLIDMLRMLDYGHLSSMPKPPDSGLTTKQAAKQALKFQEKYPHLLPDRASEWLLEVLTAADERNELTHAVALNRCNRCGTATLFQHPRTGKYIDRSNEAVQALTVRLLDLREAGDEIAVQIAKLVNKYILLGAMLLADDTGETVVPETVHPHIVKHTCGDCTGDGRATASIVLQVGSVEVKPMGLAKALLEDSGTDDGKNA
ncbi:hypothetical protein ACIBMZ_23835 [Micromonospora sp. NPDC049900]|uniref:hypothetical protein n=1 Tax=Micromonospora sp. NPDC049900 TaxID=3364275 RepID=UPI00378DB89A